MRLTQIWRHPVKSFQGEQLTSAVIEESGLHLDRAFGIIDDESGRIMTARRDAALLYGRARVDALGEVVLEIPEHGSHDAETFSASSPGADSILSSWLGRPVHLAASLDHSPVIAQSFTDPIDESSPLREWQLPKGRFLDSAPLLLITTQTLHDAASLHPRGRWDVRRFRPNLVVDASGAAWLEDSWQGLTVRIGSALITVRKLCGRCTMVTRAQPGIEADREIFKSLAHVHGATFGVLCDVVSPGTIRLDDEVELLE